MKFLWTVLLTTPLVLLGAAEDYPYLSESDNVDIASYMDEQYSRHIHSLINAYKGDNKGETDGPPLVIETNALINTHFRSWKRNADLINSLLALPKGMNDAGR